MQLKALIIAQKIEILILITIWFFFVGKVFELLTRKLCFSYAAQVYQVGQEYSNLIFKLTNISRNKVTFTEDFLKIEVFIICVWQSIISNFEDCNEKKSTANKSMK